MTPAGAGGPTDAPYMAVSEASDDMYAAIEDPSYIPTGTSQVKAQVLRNEFSKHTFQLHRLDLGQNYLL